MLIHLDTSLLVDAFTGARRSLPAIRTATAHGEILTFSTLVLYEWLRGPRTDSERGAVNELFDRDTLPGFGRKAVTGCVVLVLPVNRPARCAAARHPHRR